eukprot:comp17623_c0_seq1/m.30104 comp17623_c0_seq1/g.30104  ORF comp17623_c0_seq1/g.30104 comp17623_c0_seq1/m.30104 type:complete len:323 (+) comp17623_c0_seq1:3-971(+)
MHGRLCVLGSGTSEGVPRVSCLTAPSGSSASNCPACTNAVASQRSKNRRRNTSVVIQVDGLNILIDCGKQFWEGAIEWFVELGIRRIDAVILTHDHADACLGLDNLRDFTSNVETLSGNKPGYDIQIYLRQNEYDWIERAFPYLVNKSNATGGGKVPSLRYSIIKDKVPFSVCGKIPVVPFEVAHGLAGKEKYTCLGFRFGDVCYISDCSEITDDDMRVVFGTDAGPGLLPLRTFFLDTLRITPKHVSHFVMSDTEEFLQRAQAAYPSALAAGPDIWLIGMNHDLEHDATNRDLAEKFKNAPFRMQLAHDGQVIDRISFGQQ